MLMLLLIPNPFLALLGLSAFGPGLGFWLGWEIVRGVVPVVSRFLASSPMLAPDTVLLIELKGILGLIRTQCSRSLLGLIRMRFPAAGGGVEDVKFMKY